MGERLLVDGARVTLVARSTDALVQLRAERPGLAERCYVIAADIAGIEDFDDFLADVERDVGALDGVVHAAGNQLRKPAIDVSAEEFRRIQEIHLVAPFLLSTALARRQIARARGGSHVFIGSLGSSIAIPGASPYTAAKSGVIGIVHALAVELAPHAIRVNAVKPGYVETALTSDLLSIEAQRARVLGRTPLGRLGRPEEIAAAVAFLLGDDAGYITGEAINVDGGWLAS